MIRLVPPVEADLVGALMCRRRRLSMVSGVVVMVSGVVVMVSGVVVMVSGVVVMVSGVVFMVNLIQSNLTPSLQRWMGAWESGQNGRRYRGKRQ